MKNIILHTIHCHKCNELKEKLDKEGIEYSINEDMQIMMQKGYQYAPMLEVDGTSYNFQDALKWLEEQKNVNG